MASACALAIISGIGFLFGIQKSLRAFLNPLFTGGVVEGNGSCSAAFCESAALRGKPSQSAHCVRSQLPRRGSFIRADRQMAKSSPFGGAVKAVRL